MCARAKTEPLNVRSLMANQTYAFYTSRKAAEIHLMNIKPYLKEFGYDAYILDESNGKSCVRLILLLMEI